MKKSLQIKKQNDEKLSKYKNIFNALLKKNLLIILIITLKRQLKSLLKIQNLI